MTIFFVQAAVMHRLICSLRKMITSGATVYMPVLKCSNRFNLQLSSFGESVSERNYSYSLRALVSH